MLSVGIVGLPNVGKSTLFNALLKKSPFALPHGGATEGQESRAKIANYPFTTIEPNVGIIEVPDERLAILAQIVKTQRIVPAAVKFVDIAGLVAGAHKGEGLGNKFLSHISEVNLIVHVLRAFEDENVIRSGSTNLLSDLETIETELILSDLAKLTAIVAKNAGQENTAFAHKLIGELNKGIPARNIKFSEKESSFIRDFFLLTAKPVIYVLNVSEDNLNTIQRKLSQDEGEKAINDYTHLKLITQNAPIIALAAKMESELTELAKEEQINYLSQYGLTEPGLDRLIKKAYETLGLISFLTAGEKEVRAWTIKKGAKAPQAAGVIHTDFEKGFIKAETVTFEDFVKYGGWLGARVSGKIRLEGKEYPVQNGDVVEFKFNL